MELVYLWVEKYKNIENQGFNFSPRFNCEYDEKTKKLTIKEKKDYVSIFHKNINVTAIIGENGSGKSSILEELLGMAQNNYKYKVCIYDNKSKEIYINTQFNSKDSSIYSKIITSQVQFSKDLTNNSFFYHYKNDIDIPIFKNNYGIYNESKIIFSEPNKGKNYIDIKKKEKRTLLKLINLVVDGFYEKIKSSEFFIPRHISLELIGNIGNDDSTCWTNYKISRNNIKKTLTEKDLLILDSIMYIQVLSKSKFYENSMLDKMELCEKDLKSENIKSKIDEYYKYFLEEEYQIFINKQIEKDSKSNYYNEKDEIIIEIKKTLVFLKNIDKFLNLLNGKYDFCTISIKKLKENEENIKLLQNLPNFLELSFYSSRPDYYTDLSTGEKALLEIIYSISDIISKRKQLKPNSNIFILIDESENNLNPLWQKKILKILLSFGEVFDISIHFLITTHSPFILSDLPKENVMFLEKGKQVYPFASGQQTFGANIHTLLSHGFFMKDGLIGEFAKNKIEEVIKYLNDESSEEIKTNNEAQNIINMIGEPIIKRELQRKLDSKKLSKLDKIDEIEEQMKLLEHRLESIRKNQK